MTEPSPRPTILALWLAAAAIFLGGATALLIASDRYQWALRLADLPTVAFALALAGAGVALAAVALLISATIRNGLGDKPGALAIILVTGLLMRALMIPSTAILEDDFYRYLWDGAVTAHGINPFKTAPGDAMKETAPGVMRDLAAEGRGVLERVNHLHLKTIYPPVAQVAFAAAYLIEPWSLRAWRIVCLLGELATVGLGLLLLTMIGRPRVWIALYWLNPLVVKELMNSGHMEAIVLPFVIAAVLLLARRQALWASVPLGLAIGAKVWPVVLVPLVLRPLLVHPDRLIGALAILGITGLLWGLPPLLGGLDKGSGFVAYASYWQTNSALFLSVGRGMGALLDVLQLPPDHAGTASRALVAGIVGVVAVWAAWQPIVGPRDAVTRAAIIVLTLFFLSPAQFPWYATWALVFLPFVPLLALIGATVFLPLYYLSFHFVAVGDHTHWAPWLVWIEWVPIWLLLMGDGLRAWRRPLEIEIHRPWDKTSG